LKQKVDALTKTFSGGNQPTLD